MHLLRALPRSFSNLSNRHHISKDEGRVRIRGKLNPQSYVNSMLRIPIDIISPGTSLTLGAFIEALKLQANSSSIGKIVVSRFQLRKSKRLPFRHEYVLFFIESGGNNYVIRVDRLGNLGSLTKGMRWHLGSFGIGGYSKDCVRIEKVDSDAGRLLKCDTAGSSVLADLHHWSSILKNEEYYTSLWKAAANLLQDIDYRMNKSERTCIFIPLKR
ncbi:unnamed protein product [Rhizoctonia solani]|uniref:Uncharacterized protein n=1 Tax=Rhizoctonia solani TaxID=456999 RepID=A0A8H3BG46_9AGAM|nr:unnamed protein product [Rhizoctonia solani]